MRRLQAAAASGDRGAYAILYAVLMTVLLGMAALVMDVASVRADRRTAKAAADAGAVAGAGALGVTSPNPQLACKESVMFAAATIGATVDTSGCSAFPGSAACTPTTATITKGFAAEPGGWTVEVHWPVSNTSELMLTPSVETWTDTPTEQLIAPADGDPCSRVGSRVHRTRPLMLAAALGYGSATRAQDSVALAEIREGEGKLVAPLIVLDPHSCNALNATGDGGVTVKANGTTPGVIAVDSDGTGGEVDCNGGKKTITVVNNSQIWAEDSVSGGKARIMSYALPDSLATSYDQAQTSDTCQPTPGSFDTNFPLCPRPSPQGARITRSPFDQRYNCKVGCLPSKDYVDQFKRYVGLDPATGTYTPGPAMSITATDACSSVAASYTGETFLSCLTGSATVTVSGETVIDAGGGKVRIDAKILSVTGTLVLKNAQVNLNVDRLDVNGCLIINPPATETYAETCASTTPLQTATGYATTADMPPMWVRGEMRVGGAFIARQAFILQPRKADPLNGRLNISTGGRVYWSAPFGKSAVPAGTCVPAASTLSSPTVACFEDLALWNEWDGAVNNPDVLNGQSQLFVDGTFFTPDSGFTFGGGVAQSQTRAQFVAKRLNLNGQGVLTLTPDAERSTLIPFVVGALIR